MAPGGRGEGWQGWVVSVGGREEQDLVVLEGRASGRSLSLGRVARPALARKALVVGAIDRHLVHEQEG